MKIVIIGGCAAGPKTAAKVKRMQPEYEVQMYTDEEHVSYSACGLPYFIEGYFEDYNKLIIRTPEDFEKNGIRVFTKHECTQIFPDKKIVIINGNEVSYDKLVLTMGSKVKVPFIENIDLYNVFHLKRINDGMKIKRAMQSAKNAVIVGAGFIGIELLEAMVKNGIKTSLIESTQTILSSFDEDISSIIKDHIIDRDGDMVKFYTEDLAQSFIGENVVKKVITKNGLELDADLVILSTGVIPNVDIAAKAGIEIGETSAIKVNKQMQTSNPDIYAAGDCAEKYSLIDGTPMWVALGSIASKEGRTAAINIGGGQDSFGGILGSAVTRYFNYTMSQTGYTVKEAKLRGYDPICSTVEKYDKAGYMHEAKNIIVKLVVDKNTREILGAQGVGCGDADKRVNAVSSAIQGGLSIDEFLSIDLTYAPPYSTPIDPLVNAAYEIQSKLNKKYI